MSIGFFPLFDELQYFGTHRVSDYYAWAKVAGGNLVRAYTYFGDTGDVEQNVGAITPEELALGFDKFPQSAEDFDDDTVLPNEEDVLDIAKAW